MKNKIYIIVLLLFSALHLQAQSQSTSTEAFTGFISPNLSQDMKTFFCQTLERNYGKANGKAITSLIEGLRHYKSHYIIDVDKKAFRKINDELFEYALTNYFFDRDRIIIEGKTDWENYDPYQALICERYLKKEDKNTYYQRELQTSNHPYLKEVCRLYECAGSESIPVYLGQMMTNHLGCMDDFEQDEDIQMFVTLIFWRYLCYCANIDFRTGQDKIEAIKEKTIMRTPFPAKEYQYLLKQTLSLKKESDFTKEELKFYIKWFDFINKHIYMENKYQKLSVGKEEFEKAGIPGIYYDILSQQMADTNREVNILDHYMKRIPPEEWEKQMEEAKKRYWEKDRPALIKRLEKL